MKSRRALFGSSTYFLDDPTRGGQFHRRDQRRMPGRTIGRARFISIAAVGMQNNIGLQTRDDAPAPIGADVAAGSCQQRRRVGAKPEDWVRELASEQGFTGNEGDIEASALAD